MTYFKPVEVDYENDRIYIPHVNGSYSSFKILEEDGWKEFLERAGHEVYPFPNRINYGEYSSTCIFTKLERKEEAKKAHLSFYVYDVEDLREEKLFLICQDEIQYHDFEDIRAVCVPRHYFNVLKFIKDNFLPFHDTYIEFS